MDDSSFTFKGQKNTDFVHTDLALMKEIYFPSLEILTPDSFKNVLLLTYLPYIDTISLQ